MAAVYADLENHALAQPDFLIGSPGAVTLRENASGSQFHVRQYYDFDGKKKDQYIGGRPGSPDTEKLVNDWRLRIAEAKDVLNSVRLLSREGYSTLSPKQIATVGALARYRIFESGALLVGAHAFGVIVNRLGIRAAHFATEDVDVATAGHIVVPAIPEGGMLEMLRESGVDFVEVPPLVHGDAPSKFKERGRSRFTVDLLVPASGTQSGIEEVPELKAHATALPFLRYLLSETQRGAVLSNHGVVAVRVPVPERFALHKMIVSQLRTARPEKSAKDLKQAASLVAALGELHPGALEGAFAKTPVSTRKHIRTSLRLMRKTLEELHPRAWEEIAALVKP